MVKLYFPESFKQVDHVGYNHAVSLFNSILGDYIVKNPKEADFRVYCNLPWHHKPKLLKENNLPLIHYTMYESTSVPKSWVKFLNKHVDIVLVPSQWCKEIFINSGVKKPIYILSLCYDERKIKYISKDDCKDNYVFLWQGVALDFGGRKGVDVVKEAFEELKEEGKLKEDAKLILKVKPWKDKQVIIDHVENSKGIIYIQDNISREQLLDLYKTVDCCINTTHGEGFGLIPLEQMAMGKPVLVTDWSMPYVDKQICYPLKYTLKKSPVYYNHKFVSINWNGIAFNLGGLYKEFRLSPKMRTLKEDGKNVIGIWPPGFEKPKISFFQLLANRINNLFCKFQQKTGFYFNINRKIHVLYNEYPGDDAFVDKEHLKDTMVYCYNNRTIAEDKGFIASEYVSKEWNRDKMLYDFFNLIPIFNKFKKENKCQF